MIALDELRSQTAAHCSFCDGFPVDGVSNETIEHFRPKCVGRFPQHAYTWRNLYYCCNACQTAKGEQWDDGLLAPDEAGYAFSHYFEFDFTTGAIRPAHGLDEAAAQRAEVTISLYGLDTAARRRCRLLEGRDWASMDEDTRNLDLRAYRNFLEP
ncbi:MAG: hypothetical protein JWN40_1054 [Phycisphaerales bacterium]|nr:hypothetical protein [Phycisphaerales bacterium]